MEREELKELHYITPIANVPSIIVHGILSYNSSQKIQHESCASNNVQERRAKVVIPGGGALHEYANVYINARNSMMYSLQEKHHDLVILSVSATIVDLPWAIITDRNAARSDCIFKSAADGLTMIDKKIVFSGDWTHEDPIEEYRRKGATSAEVLIRYKIEPCHIMKAYVSCGEGEQSLKAALDQAGLHLSIEIVHIFFSSKIQT